MSIGVVASHAVAGGNYRATVLADSPLEYYRLGEASGNPLDSSGNNRTGTLTGSPARVAGLLTGDPDGAYDWDGSTTWCDIPDCGSQSAITAEALISLDGNNKVQNILARANESTTNNSFLQFILRVNASNQLEMSARKGGAWVTCTGTTALALGTRYHVAGTADGSAVKVYVNATLENTVANAGALSSLSALGGLIAAGYNGAIYAKFDGKIDEAAIYGSALAATRIAAHYAAA